MSAYGMLETIAWTQLHDALEEDGFSPGPKSGPAVTQFIRDMIALGQSSRAAPAAVPVDLSKFRDAVMHAYGLATDARFESQLGELLDLLATHPPVGCVRREGTGLRCGGR